MIARIVPIATLLVVLFSSTALADYIQGHVVGIDREHGTVDNVLCDMESDDVQGCRVKNGQLAEHGEDSVRIRVVVSWLPRCLAEGMMVFARGEYVKDDASRFEAVEVFPRKRLGSGDETGVRSRFRHQRGRGHQQERHEE
jgi:hypothetical protein